MTRRMSFVLWFFVVAAPYYLLGLHFHFSAKGSLLSSAIAAAFGGLNSLAAKKHTVWQPALTLLSPFAFIGSFLLFCPAPVSLLFGLTLTALFVILCKAEHGAYSIVREGRGELSLLLQSAADSHLTQKYAQLFRSWSIGTLVTFTVYSMFPSPWIAFIPLTAIAVLLSSVVNSGAHKEFK